jgi:aspartate racemase
MAHTGILAQNIDGGALCFVTYCREGLRRLGGHTYPDLTMDYIGFGHSLTALRDGNIGAIRDTFGRSVAQLAGAGADFFVCADNTAHLVLDLPGPDFALPGLHVGQVVASHAREAGHRRVGILGTNMVMSSDLYPSWLGRYGIDVEVPSPEDREAIDAIVFGELVDGVVTDASRDRLVSAVERFAAAGCDAVALASTEIPSILTPETSPLPTLDTCRLAARRALEIALDDHPLPSWRGGPHPELRHG